MVQVIDNGTSWHITFNIQLISYSEAGYDAIQCLEFTAATALAK